MTNKDWDPDDLLDFHFDHPAPSHDNDFDIFDELKDMSPVQDHGAYKPHDPGRYGKPEPDQYGWYEPEPYRPRRSEPQRHVEPEHSGHTDAREVRRGLDTTSFDSYDELKRYEELRKQKAESADVFSAQSSGSGRGGRSAPREVQSDAPSFSFEDPEHFRIENIDELMAAERKPKPAPAEDRGAYRPDDIEQFYIEEPLSSHRHEGSRSARMHEDPGSARMHEDAHSAHSSAASQSADPFKIEPPLSRTDESIFEQYDREYGENAQRARALVEEPDEPHILPELPEIPLPEIHAPKDVEALKKASRDAYEKYRSNYTKKQKKKAAVAAPKIGKGHKWLTAIYTVALASFALSMTIINILPPKMLIALYVILALLSILIFVQVRRHSIKVWGRRLATALAVILVIVYGMGTAYAMSTLSFLNRTSVDNEKCVANITKDPFNVVITGIDVSGTIEEEGRSDVNMVLTVNPDTAQLLMTSIPRDYEIYMPDHDNAMDKLTHTGFYGVPTTVMAEEDLLDITANYYVKVNFSTVEKFIDAIGGIDVYSEYEFNPVKMKDWTVQEGWNHMNGKQALAFARERKAFLTGDNQRIKNQQAVFEAMFKKATSSRTMIFSYNKILNNLKDYFEMSFSSREIRSLARMQLARFPDWHIYKNTVIGGDGSLPTYSTGGAYAYVMTQDEESINNAKTLINAVMNGQALQTDDDGVVTVVDSEESEETEE